MSETIVNSEQSKAEFVEKMSQLYDKHKFLRITVKTGKQRTNKQNAALHKYLSMLSDELNAAGYDMKRTLKHEVDIPWNSDLAKDYLWRPIQKAVTGHDSTTKPERKQYSEIYEVLTRHLGSKTGVYVPWPHIE